MLGMISDQFFRGKIHGSGTNPANSRNHCHGTHRHYQLQQSNPRGSDPAGKINLKGCPHQTQQQVNTGQQQCGVKYRNLSLQENPPLSTEYADKGGIEQITR